MKTDQVETLCPNLSPLLKNTIRTKILGYQDLPKNYNFGESLIFWIGDMLTGVRLVTPDQLRLILEEFADRIRHFGDALEAAWKEGPVRGIADFKRLPVCKIGFLDRHLACIDGESFFIDLSTGERVPATDNWPLETLAYNLTTLFVRYNRSSSSSPELGVSHDSHGHPHPRR